MCFTSSACHFKYFVANTNLKLDQQITVGDDASIPLTQGLCLLPELGRSLL